MGVLDFVVRKLSITEELFNGTPPFRCDTTGFVRHLKKKMKPM